MAKIIKLTESQIKESIKRVIHNFLNEEKEYYDFWDEQVGSVGKTIQEFLGDKKNGVTKKRWRVIPVTQYKRALTEFVRYGKFMRFPTKNIEKWEWIIIENVLSIYAITELAGHSPSFPIDEFCDAFGYDYKEYVGDGDTGGFEKASNELEELGFYDWAILPDGSSAWSDYGLEPLMELLKELEDVETPEEKIVVINKIMNVVHQRGDLASAFIQGGYNSLTSISS